MMKKNLLILMLALFLSGMGYAQLSGTYAIPGTLPSGYPTFAAAISDLNTLGVGLGGVTFNVATGYSETLPSATAGTITTATGSASNPILFQKSGSGANPIIRAASLTGSSTTDGIIVLAGTDYVTFDGIDVLENALNISNRTEWGYAILMASATDASQNIQIKNCSITLDKINTASVGVYSKNHNSTSSTAIVPTDPTGAVSNCSIDNCNIQNIYSGIAFTGYNSSAPYALYGQNNHFGQTMGNTITNFGGGSVQPYAIFTIYQNGLVVANNTINGGNGTTTGLNGIYINTSNNADVDIYANTVTLISNSTSVSSLYGIYNAGSSVGTTNTVNIYGNIVENCQQLNSNNGNWYLINNAAFSLNANIHDNIVRNNTKAALGGSIYMFYLVSAKSNDTENIYNNQVYGNVSTGSASTIFYCMYNTNVSVTKNIYSNTFYNNTTSSSSSMYGLFNQGGTTVNIYKNNIYDLNLTASGIVLNYGIRINGGTNVNIFNNLISDIKAPNSTSNFALRGIAVDNGTNVGIFNNTIFLNGSGATNFGSSCVNVSTTPIIEMRNNLLVNTSVASGTGKTIAYWRQGTILGTYASTSGNNDFYAGTPGPQNLIYYDGTTGYQELADYKTLVSPADAASFTEMPPFVNSVIAPYDLHINAATPTQCESGGSIVSTPVDIAVDYANTPRFPNTGYPNNITHPATAPDAGAFEFGGISVDLSPPGIGFNPLMNTSLFSNRTLTATITDATGVPTTGAGLPVCYWKIDSGPYLPAQGIHLTGTNKYMFIFGSGVVTGSVVSYYIMAQDLVSPPNVGSNPSAGTSGYTINPPASATPPANPYTYTVIAPISGVVTVGTGGTYPSLTGVGGLFEDINSKALTGNINAFVISDLTEDGTNSLNKWVEDGLANYSVTIQPDAATERLIQGSVANAMIRFSGAVNAKIDGRFNGSGKFLRFRNTNTLFSDMEFSNDAKFNTVRDCYWEGGNTATSTASTGIIRFYTSTGIDGNSNNSVLNNVISDINGGSTKPYTSIFALGTASAINSNNIISGNEVANFTAYGIYISSYNDSVVLSGNSLYNTMTTPLTTTPRCIYVVSGAGGDANTIAGNYIGGSAAMCGGSPWIHNSSGGIYGIYLSAGSIVPTEVYNNVFSNIHSIHTGSGGFYGIYTTSTGVFHIGTLGGNIIGSETTSNSILMDGTNTFRGIYQLGTTPGNTIDNNTVGNISWSALTGSQSNIFGMVVYAAQVRNNKVFKMGGLNPGFTPTIYGIDNNGAPGIMNEYSNNIIDLDGGASADPQLVGFYESSSTTSGANLYFNTIYIHGPATATNSTYAFRRVIAATNVMKGNIFFNDRAAGGTGSHYAIYDNVTASITSDYNNLLSTSGSLGYFNSTPISNLATWMIITSLDMNSVSGNPNFVSATDYHPTNPLLNNAGIAIPGITTDFSGATRSNPPDVGVLEFQFVPGIYTTAATSITGISAVLNGNVDPFGESVVTSFEYGLTTAYGNTINATPSPISGVVNTTFSAALGSLIPNTTYHFRAVGIANSLPLYGDDFSFTTDALPPTVVTLAASNVGLTDATLNGTVNANAQNSTVSFEYGLTTSYGNTTAAVPASVTGFSVTPVNVAISSLLQNTTYHFRVVAVNATGTSYGEDMTFLTGCLFPDPAGPVSGPLSICQSTSGVTFSVAPIPNASSYVWTVPAGGTITSGATSNSITVDFSGSAVSGSVTANGVGSCGNGVSSSLSISLYQRPNPTITGPSTLCAGTIGNVYTTEAGMSNYIWSVTGGAITAGTGTNSITVIWSTAGAQTVNVNYDNSNGCSAVSPVSYPVSVIALPVPTISGENIACESSAYLDYATEPGMTNYVWDMTPNSGTMSQSTTNVTTIFWTAPGAKWVSVTYTDLNGCSAATPAIYNVTVNPLPGTPGNITGQTTVCAGTNAVAYSVAAVSNATTYVWTLPAGATIATGVGTNSITVNYSANAISGTISVLAQNSCGDGQSSVLAVSVNTLPVAAGAVMGQSVICQGSTGVIYSVDEITGATSYNWTLPAGASIGSGANTNSITVDFSLAASSGNITVNGVNACGTGIPSTMMVTVNAKPATPVITRNEDILTSNAATGNQWYRDGILIPGALDQTYTVTDDGTYTVVVTLNGCSSDVSNSIVVLHTGITNPDVLMVNIYPNPTTGAFWLSINSPGNSIFEMEILNSLGSVVYKSDKLEVNGAFKQFIDLRDLSNGMYTLILRSDSQKIVKKIVINN
jgi:trimeric autotransporter adhesin